MRSEEFAQVVKIAFRLAKTGMTIEQLENDLFYIDELRKRHKRYQDELEYLFLDPFSYEKTEEREMMNMLAKDIKEACISGNITSELYKMPKDHSEFRKLYRGTNKFAKYTYRGEDITQLVVISKKKEINKIKEGTVEFIDDDKLELFSDKKESGVEVSAENGYDENGKDILLGEWEK